MSKDDQPQPKKGSKNAHSKIKFTAEKRAKAFLRKGQIAFNKGDTSKAHLLWQRSAYLNPKDATVWLELYKVVTNDDDRRACLENALRLRNDPRIAQHLKTLNKFKPKTLEPQPKAKTSVLKRIIRIVVSAGVIIALFIVGLFIGMTLNTWLT
jgi:hypothetical protein